MGVYIIAEAGVNHNGSLSLAKELVDKAKFAGVDCIKFQTFISENVVTKSTSKANYQITNCINKETQYDMLKRLELTYDEFIELKNYCDLRCIEFLSTAGDLKSIEFLYKLGLKKWKIPSGDITNLPYIINIAKYNKPVILSTGMSTIDDIKRAVKVLKEYGTTDITVLHCTTEYPVPYKDVNLNAMLTIKDKLNIKVGYSDHTKGITITVAAVALGATVIEKHFTLDRNMEGPDHMASLEPAELKSMVDSIRNVEIALGDGIKQPAESEFKNMVIVRKSIVAEKFIKKGEIFNKENLAVKRPGNGINPMKWFDVIGKCAIRDFKKDELIEL